MKKEALLYEKKENQSVKCLLCAHECLIEKEKYGFCGVRQNLEGKLFTHVYGNIIAAHVDPIEKKPLYHFLPGSKSFSIATIGCNFRCHFCQNWEISQLRKDQILRVAEKEFTPEEIVAEAIKNGCKSISFTYTEPTVFFEFALDVAKLSFEKGLSNIFVTNGFMSKKAIEMIAPYLSAANIDLKFFKEDSYKKVCAGRLEPVLNSIRLLKKLGIWVEVTTLIVPKQNDNEKELKNIAEFIAELDKNIPWHISRFFPNYKFDDLSATGDRILKIAEKIGHIAGLNYVYVGNAYGWDNDTVCFGCKKSLIKRNGFAILENNIEQGVCKFCKHKAPGKFD